MKDLNRLIASRLEQADAALADAACLLDAEGSAAGIVNRAYYAMFYAVLALLQKIKRVPNKHSGAIALFDLEFVKMGIFPKAMSKELHRAFEMRQISDYQSMSAVTRKEAEEILEHARSFVGKISKALKTGPDGEALLTGDRQVREKSVKYHLKKSRKRK